MSRLFLLPKPPQATDRHTDEWKRVVKLNTIAEWSVDVFNAGGD